MGNGLMAKIEFSGMEKYQKQILKFQKKLEAVLGQAIYAGASVVADEIKDGIRALPLLSGYGTKETPLSGGATKAQKEGLLEGFGIAPMQNSKGFVNVKLGFDGYNATKTEHYPNGQPNQLVARGIESGTSWKRKTPFVAPAVKRARNRTEKVMDDKLNEQIEKLMD